MQPASGGVQNCTREYVALLQAAGFHLHIVATPFDSSLKARVMRRLRTDPYLDRIPEGFGSRVVEEYQRTGSQILFLNLGDFAPLADEVRASIAGQIVLLSHGLESVDYLHAARGKGRISRREERILGRRLFAEAGHREAIDEVFCLAPFEAEIERWLGAKRATWLPRPASNGLPLDWQPRPERLGCVSTLDHAPNRSGLVSFLEEFEKIAPAGRRFRLVGGPAGEGAALARQFPCVDYLGRLGESELRREASTWSGFVHPIFHFARGCSTKLATALEWQIPIVTTPAGQRGYRWREGALAVGEDAAALSSLAVALADPATAAAAREGVRQAALSMPAIADVAEIVRRSLQCPTPSAPGGVA